MMGVLIVVCQEVWEKDKEHHDPLRGFRTLTRSFSIFHLNELDVDTDDANDTSIVNNRNYLVQQLPSHIWNQFPENTRTLCILSSYFSSRNKLVWFCYDEWYEGVWQHRIKTGMNVVHIPSTLICYCVPALSRANSIHQSQDFSPTHPPTKQEPGWPAYAAAYLLNGLKIINRKQEIKKLKSISYLNDPPTKSQGDVSAQLRTCSTGYNLGFWKNWDPPNSVFLLCCTRLSVGVLVLVVAWVCPFWCLVALEQVTSSFSPELLISSPHRLTLARISKRKFKC